ncbi:MAG: AarF/ABC1/UbiB kinase family protein [Phormidesmis sp.]
MSAASRESNPLPSSDSQNASASPSDITEANIFEQSEQSEQSERLHRSRHASDHELTDHAMSGAASNGHVIDSSDEHLKVSAGHTAADSSRVNGPILEPLAPISPPEPAEKLLLDTETPAHSKANGKADARLKSDAKTTSSVAAYSGSTYRDGDYRWNRGTYSRPQRFIDIWSFVIKLLAKRWLYNKAWTYGGTITPEKQASRRKEIAIWLRETCLSLGPTFIKIGQLFSTRADLFPIEYVAELSKLQDRVPAFSYEQVKKTIEKDFGRSLNQLYDSFEPVPIAAASLGQVHCAELHSGEEVVVKIQRPGLSRLFEIDLSILKGIAQYFQNHREWGKGRDWMGIYEECCRLLWLEIDFLHEGRNGDKFRRNFRGVEWVKVPRIYWRYTTPRVLTMEYMPGIKISHYEALESAGLDRKRLARLGAEAYLRQLLTDGFFHADPHPGNIAVDPDGTLIFYDFGMMGQIQPLTRSLLMDTFVGIAQRDAGLVMASLVQLGALAEIDDMGPVRRSIQYILDNMMDKPFEEQSVTAISDDLYAVAYDQPFRFPATFTFVMRAFSTLEGVGKGLDPEFNFMEAAKPYATELMTNGMPGETNNGLFGEISRQAAQVGSSALSLPRRIEDTLDRLDRGDIRVRVRSIESDRILRRNSNLSLANSYTLLVGTFTLSATLLLISEFILPAAVMAIAASTAGIALIRLLMRIAKADRMP